MNGTSSVSILLGFKTGEHFLREAIASVMGQDYDNWELLLADDGSRDASTSLAKRYAAQHSAKVRYLEHPGHQQRGLSATRKLGLHHAKGEYIAFLEPDDLWLPQKLERQMAILKAEPRAKIVVGLSHLPPLISDDRGNGLRTPQQVPHVQTNALYDPPTLAALFSPVGPSPSPSISSLLIHRDTIHQLHGFDERFRDLNERYADQAFFAKAVLTQPVFIAGESWVTPRIDPGTVTSVTTDPKASRLARLFYLNWLGTQMLEHEITNAGVWSAFQKAISEFGSPDNLRHPLQSGDDRPSKWRLRIAGENAASLVFPPEQSDLVRVEIKRAHSRPAYDIQLNLPHLKVKADHRYRITFRTRADHPRTICVGLAKTEAPWSGLGFYQAIELTPEWQTCEQEFIVQSNEENARILFDLGTESPSVEILSVTLTSLPDGTLIEPDLSLLRPIDAYQMEQFFVRQATDIRGRVLEVGDGTLARRYGGERVAQVVVWQMESGGFRDCATGRRIDPSHLPTEHFDSMILPHVLHSLQDVRKAIHSFSRALKPGGVLLATLPGIVPTYDLDWGRSWAWTFTPLSVQRIFEEAFSKVNVTTQAFGNVPAVISLVHTLPSEVLQQQELDRYEPGYEVLMTVRAVKPIEA